MYIKHYHETSLHRHYLTRDILGPNREFNCRGRGGTRRRIKLLRSSCTLRLFLWLFNFFWVDRIITKKINTEDAEGTESCCFLCVLCGFFKTHFRR